MERVGVRDLKANLSKHLRRVRAGAALVVTDRGRDVATLAPVEDVDARDEVKGIRQMVAAGRASWSGGKPGGLAGVRTASGPTLASTILDDRR